MGSIEEYIREAEAGRIVRLSDVMETFAHDPDAAEVLLSLTLFDGSIRYFPCPVARWKDNAERAFVLEYVLARLGNILSALGGLKLTVTVPGKRPEIAELFIEAECVLRSGDGYTKPLKVINRIDRITGRAPFTFAVVPGRTEVPEADAVREKAVPEVSLAERLKEAEARAETGVRMGIDVGGTDIKAVVYRDGVLVGVKEFDWDPARSPDAEGLIYPIVLIARVLRAAVAIAEEPHPELSEAVADALAKDASQEEMACTADTVEAACAPGAGLADSIGISFPDVVLGDRICGDETPKTRGIRKAVPERYEREFLKLAHLNERLGIVLKPDGAVHMTNDGNVAAYTAAVELAHGEDPSLVEKGVFAHSLGTDLGTGRLQPDGTFPFAPLECYDFRIDLGSRPQRAYPPKDLRSNRNSNTGLPGAARYVGQGAAFRLLWERVPELMLPYTEEREGYPRVRREPKDMRKPLLAHIMALADAGNTEAEAVFRQIGENLGTVSREIDAILQPETETRLIFGRFVKSARCFELIEEGCAATYPQLKLAAADESIANTALMRALAERKEYTVAQFGQAVGAAVFGAQKKE